MASRSLRTALRTGEEPGSWSGIDGPCWWSGTYLEKAPLRYGDLLSSLAPIATDMLAGRLRDLEATRPGAQSARCVPKPASTTVYELTDDGRALEDVDQRLLPVGPAPDRDPRARRRGASRMADPARCAPTSERDRDESPVTVRLVTPDGQAAVVEIGPDSVGRVRRTGRRST